MRRFALCLILLPALAFADALPEVRIEPAWQQCRVDSDCDIVRDACRSCGAPIALHKDFIDDYLARDYQQRVAAGIFMACEACSQQEVVVRCGAAICQAKRP